MDDNWQKRLAWSQRMMAEVVWPAVIPQWFPGAWTVRLEGKPEHWVEDVDMGIDWQIVWDDDPTSNTLGIATRAQRVPTIWAYNTFTIRSELDSGMETELARRLRSIEGLDYVVHAYIKDEQELVKAAVVKAVDLFDYVGEGKAEFRRTVRKDRTRFRAVKWEDLIRDGADIRIWQPEG